MGSAGKMLRHFASAAAVLSLLCTSGCLIESNIDANGGAVVTLSYKLKKDAKLDDLKKQMESADVEVTEAKQADDGTATFKMKLKDITKLSTTKFFKRANIKRTVDAAKGTTTITTNLKNKKPTKISDAIKKFYGDEVKIVTTVPGEIAETNAKSKDGKTATWAYTMDEFFTAPEVSLNLTYKNPS
jgi:outer membrane murein-binding lipoprotein Lpp